MKLEFLDTAGQERFSSINKIFIKDSNCIIFRYEIKDISSFNKIKKYHFYDVWNIVGDEPLIYFVANKIDLIENAEFS